VTGRDRTRTAFATGERELRQQVADALCSLAGYVEHGRAPAWFLEHCRPLLKLGQKLMARRRQPAEVVRLEDRFTRPRLVQRAE
jgi:hypothetical protein